MTNAIVSAPVFSAGDDRQAKAYAGRTARGRATRTELVAWHHAGRPVLAPIPAPTAQPGVGKGKHTGKRGGASTFNLGGITRKLAAAEAYSVRQWHLANTDELLKGRLPLSVVQDWIDAGMPAIEAPTQVVATVYAYTLDKAGRKNGTERIIELTRDDIANVRKGKPAMADYVTAASVKVDRALWPVQVVTLGMKINAERNDDGTFTYSWVSKRDVVGTRWVNA